MNICRRLLPYAFFGLCGIALLASLPAPATTYTTYVTPFGNSGQVMNYGLTDSGSVVTFDGDSYKIFTPPATMTNVGANAPALPFDDGVRCNPGPTASPICF